MVKRSSIFCTKSSISRQLISLGNLQNSVICEDFFQKRMFSLRWHYTKYYFFEKYRSSIAQTFRRCLNYKRERFSSFSIKIHNYLISYEHNYWVFNAINWATFKINITFMKHIHFFKFLRSIRLCEYRLLHWDFTK